MRPPPPPPPQRPPPSQERPTNGDKVKPAAVPPAEVVNGQSSPLKAAADLIQILDTAYADMSSFAADAARDAEGARRNARAASEIARRYQNRSYPKVHSPFGSSSLPRTPHTGGGEYKLQENDNPEQTPRHGALTLLATMTPKHPNTDSTGSMRKTYNTPTSTERLAQSHAEEVLSLSLELERAKQDYISEKKSHDHTKASMLEVQYKNNSLEEQLGKLMKELEKQRKDAQLKIDSLQEELAYTKRQIEAAEEDAQVALDIAKESAAKREHMEDLLHSSLQEVTMLREQVEHSERSHEGTDRDDSEKGGSVNESVPEPVVMETPRRSVRFADSPDTTQPANFEEEEIALETPKPDDTSKSGGTIPGSGPSRSMVAAGRQLLRRAMAEAEGQNVCSYLEVTPAKSAEKMRRLRHRLLGLEDEPIIPSPPRHGSYSSPNRIVDTTDTETTIERITKANALEENRAVAKLLKETGRRLELDGSWFKPRSQQQFGGIPNVPPPPPPPPGKTQLEALAKQFCHRVEHKIDQHKRDITELGSLCGYLEQKIAATNKD